MLGMPVESHVNVVYLFFEFFYHFEMNEIFYNTLKDDNSTVYIRPHDDNIHCFNGNLNGS